MFYFYIPEGICFAVFAVFLHSKKRKTGKHIRKNQKISEKPQQKNTNRNVQNITTYKKRQQKQRSKFLQEYKSKTSYTPEDAHVGRNM
jgi:predicted solute-binding protein